MIVGIDLLWVRPNLVGGTESYIRNLLDGFEQYGYESMKFVLFVSKDNQQTFDKYYNSRIFIKVICNINSRSAYKRIIWENFNLNRTAEKSKIDLMFVPVYSKPIYTTKKFKYIITIHDLQALHYPEYFNKLKYIWLKFSWGRCAKTADKIVAISNFVKHDICEKLKIDTDKIQVIYNPIVKSTKSADFNLLKTKYDITQKQYLYTVSSMLPHKNLKTLLYIMKKIKESDTELPNKLLISGISSGKKEELLDLITELNIEENVVLTGFVSNEERDCLYKNASVFLFPSIFEGFGMPPIEALMYGTPVVASDIEVTREITENKMIYVKNYYDVDEWIEKIKISIVKDYENLNFSNYNLETITKQYLNLLISFDNSK